MTVIPIRRPTGDQLDQNRALWNSSSNNPAVIARQKLAADRTAFLVANSDGYARELAELQDWISSYEIPLKEDA
ncbi:hypothetical protein ACTXJ9_14050 [Brachybacterium tyrofermentans]|uniref:hypothetical protein n=1 Tax=Brachybacterium tyrofermentans TaxID=47848 RepID=UPI003FD53DF9